MKHSIIQNSRHQPRTMTAFLLHVHLQGDDKMPVGVVGKTSLNHIEKSEKKKWWINLHSKKCFL